MCTLLSAIGKKTFAVLRYLVSPDNPKDKTLDQLVEVLKQHYELVTLVIAERFTFHHCQQPGESIAEFAAELKKLSLNCKFSTYLDDALRDWLVCGLHSEATQKKLLTEKDLTFKKSLDVAQSNALKLQGTRRSTCARSPLLVVRDYNVVRRLLEKTLVIAVGSQTTRKLNASTKPTPAITGQTGHLRHVCSKPPTGKPTKTLKRKSGGNRRASRNTGRPSS